jgi:ornithine decarboxylase
MQNARFLLSKSKVLEQYSKIRKIADIVSYSSKTNPLVTRILEKETDSMFSIHTINELKHIKDKSRVLFLAQGWTYEFIKNLINQGINNFVVDNETDLDTILKFLENNNVKINLFLRIKLKEKTLRTERYFVFGMSSDVINKRLRELNNNKKIKNKLINLGIHFHRKTQNMSEWNLKYEISNILEKDSLELVDIINIGGGLPSEYINTNVDVLETIFKKINEFREWLKNFNIKLMIEPGRFIAAPSSKLVTYIIGIYENNIIVNASIYNTDLDALVVPVKLLVEGELKKGKGKPYVIKGITPCSMDLFRYRVYLKNPKIGDEIVFLNAGAYNFKSDFCDLEELETIIID